MFFLKQVQCTRNLNSGMSRKAAKLKMRRDAAPAADHQDEDSGSAYEVARDYARSGSSASSTSDKGTDDDSDNKHHVSQWKRKGKESQRAAPSSDSEKSKFRRRTGKDRRIADSDSSEDEEPKSKQGKATSKRGESKGQIPRATVPEQKTNMKRKRKNKHRDHFSDSSDEDEHPRTQLVETTSRKNGYGIWYAIAAEGYLVTQTCAEDTRDKVR